MLSSSTRAKLAEIAGNGEIMAALDEVAEETKRKAVQNVQPPMALDEYGAMVGAGKFVDEFMGTIYAAGVEAAMQEEDEQPPPDMWGFDPYR